MRKSLHYLTVIGLAAAALAAFPSHILLAQTGARPAQPPRKGQPARAATQRAVITRPSDATLAPWITPRFEQLAKGKLKVVDVKTGGSKGLWGSWTSEALRIETFVHVRVVSDFFGPPADGEDSFGFFLLSDRTMDGLEPFAAGESLVFIGESSVRTGGASFSHTAALRGGGGRGSYAADAAVLLRDLAATSKEFELTERQARDIERAGPDCAKIAQEFMKHAAADATLLQEIRVLRNIGENTIALSPTNAVRKFYGRRRAAVQEQHEIMEDECQSHPAVQAYTRRISP